MKRLLLIPLIPRKERLSTRCYIYVCHTSFSVKDQVHGGRVILRICGYLTEESAFL